MDRILIGGHLKTDGGTAFASAAGFALSRGALQRIASLFDGDRRTADQLESRVGKSPDVGLAALCKELGVQMPDTRDKTGAERFNVLHTCNRVPCNVPFPTHKLRK